MAPPASRAERCRFRHASSEPTSVNAPARDNIGLLDRVRISVGDFISKEESITSGPGQSRARVNLNLFLSNITLL